MTTESVYFSDGIQYEVTKEGDDYYLTWSAWYVPIEYPPVRVDPNIVNALQVAFNAGKNSKSEELRQAMGLRS